MSNEVPSSGESREQSSSWTCPSCEQLVQGHVKRHFPIRSGDMQMRHKCPLCGHRHFRAATQQEWADFSGSMGADADTNASGPAGATVEPWLPRTCKRMAQTSRNRAEKRSLEKLHARVERATPEAVAAAHQLRIQSIVDKALSRFDSGARMVPAEVVVDLMVDLHNLVAGTGAQMLLESLLEKANANLGLYMPLVELQRSLARIKITNRKAFS